MYCFAWIALVVCAIWFSLLAFFWALEDGQFSDQNRARFLPLAGEVLDTSAQKPAWKGKERYMFFGMGAAALCMFVVAICLSLRAG